MTVKLTFSFICLLFLLISCVSVSELGNQDVHSEIQMLKKMFSDLKNVVENQDMEMKKQDMEIKKLKMQIESRQVNVCGNSSTVEKKRLLLDGQSDVNKQVAFYAHLTKNIDHLGNHQTIIFDKVRTNQGSAYKAVDGEFVANTAGTYFFIWTISNSDNTYMQSELVVNGIVYGQIISDAAQHTDWAVSTSFAVVSLQIDDRVWIRSGVVHTGHVSGVGYGTSSFAGFLLW